MTTQANEIRLVDVTKTFPLRGGDDVVAVDHVSLQIEAGSTTALMGPSGSGKSTLLHLVGAMDRPTSGRIAVGDLEISAMGESALAAYRRRVGFVFQRFHLLPALSVLSNVTAPLLPYRRHSELVARGKQLIEEVGLAGRERSLPSELSGGQQQRVAIARALINDPHVLLADEPTGNLDSATGEAILELLFSIQQRLGTTFIVATHDVSVAQRCQGLMRVHDGMISQDRDPGGAKQ